MGQIINSILDTDLYSFSIQYLYLQKFPRAKGTFKFKDRSNTVYPEGFAEKVMSEVRKMDNLQLQDDEAEWMENKLYYFPKWYITTFLKGYRFNSKEVSLWQDEEGHLHGEIKGYLWRTLFWEEPILAIVSELYHKEIGEVADLQEVAEITRRKFEKFQLHGITFSDFGTRRRFSFAVQETVVKVFDDLSKLYARGTSKDRICFKGTSNTYLAFKYDLTPIGTMAHQIVSAIGALFGYKEANYLAMENWFDVYNADLGIFLYDTYGWDAFEKNFAKKHALLYDGLRVDSGDNIDQLEKIIAKYISLGIGPSTKSVVFSNALTTDDAVQIHLKVRGRIKDSYGIGTHFTCDIPGVKPLNIVIKLDEVSITEKTETKKAVKLSNDFGKYTGDADEVQIALLTLGIKNKK